MSRSAKPKELERFGRYDILSQLASGGMARIFKVDAGGRVLILKKILPEYSKSEEFIKMFLEEAKISLSLKHSNVVRVLDFGALEGSYYLAMEYVFGKDVGSLLKNSLEQRIHIPIDAACYIILECCKGLEYAHTRTNAFGESLAVVHRDISPPNLLIGYNGEIKILDFGIAKAISAADNSQTRSGVLKGKFCYMSPEQARGDALNHQSDIFSLGIVLHELLTSKSLFYSKDEIETLERVRRAEVIPPSEIRKGVPKELDDIVLKALSSKTKTRYQSCADFAGALSDFLDKFYPRTDRRTVARLMRHLLREDFEIRVEDSRREGWRDILVSGGDDSEILLDRQSHQPMSPGRTLPPPRRVSWWHRALYDPKISRRVFKAIGTLIFLGVSYGGYQYVLHSPETQEQLTQWWKKKDLVFSPPKKKEAPALAPGTYGFFVEESKRLERAKKYEAALAAVEAALRINPLETEQVLRQHFLMLELGRVDDACPWFRAQADIELSDSILSEAICSDAAGDKSRALASYTDFLRRFPQDPRSPRVEEAVSQILRRVQP